MHRARVTTAEIDYPSSDGKPMAETDLHRDWMNTNWAGQVPLPDAT